jgi:RES domain-containing protein
VRIWRITAGQHIETVFSGVGGLYASGRWHPQGYKISYTSESLALASLEVFVHSETTDIPLACVSAVIPDATPILEITDLPANWQDVAAYPILQEIGRKWLRTMEDPVLKVPSAIIPVEYNYLSIPNIQTYDYRQNRCLSFSLTVECGSNKHRTNDSHSPMSCTILAHV